MDTITNYEEHWDQAVAFLWKALPSLGMAIIVFFIGSWVIKIINRLVRKFFEKAEYDPSLESFLKSFISIGLKIMLFVIVITQLGVQSGSLIAIIGAAGLAVGLALQGSLANFAGGVLILLFKPFKVGDWISAQGVDGSVKEISIFTTKLSTAGNQIAIIPNGQLSNNNIINYNAQNTRRDNITVGIGYSSNIKKAREILLQICAEDENILKDPAPQVFVAELGDSSVNLSLRFWTENSLFWAAHFHVMEELKLRFDDAEIEIPFPQRVLYNKQG
ncbi:Small-conductance mechanosensitive channel [Arenibacter antarcticus]|uniref:Mechanosensitive ion channel family protein n=1 Tax=Arenibacter antarcticus TaxID=2040469 RepID=A0ABW5VFV5_9FLAO|nr:mechanosensitive ion channel domain-containing protein [Arenibacter sp. H213]MCM4169322.1 mechanosensitive ion channel protein [Arenibacter sp. H213]